MRSLFNSVLLGSTLVIVLASHSSASAEAAKSAVAIDPIQGIVSQFKTHSVVALGDGVFHGEQNSHEFRLSLIHDPRFQATVDDIVLEAYNSRYQSVVDSYVLGREVQPEELQKAWRDSTQVSPGIDAPMRAEILAAIRDVNAKLPDDSKLRVLLADPPIDWSRVKRKEDVDAYVSKRESFAAELIEREVLQRGRKALVIFGQMHLVRHDLFANFSGESQWLLPLLERQSRIRAFTVWVAANLEDVQPDIKGWSIPSLTVIEGTRLGAMSFSYYYPHEVARFTQHDGKPVLIRKSEWRKAPDMQAQVDAILYMGPQAALRRYTLELDKCNDPSYVALRLERMRLVNYPSPEESLRSSCSSLNTVPTR